MSRTKKLPNYEEQKGRRKAGESWAQTRHRLPPEGIPVKKQQKRDKFSQTPGSSKVESCQATPFDKIHAKRNRSWRWDTYPAWCARMDSKAKRI